MSLFPPLIPSVYTPTMHQETPAPVASPRPTTSLAVARELLLLQMRQLMQPGVNPREIAPIMLWGPPGIGKSDLIRELCAEQGWGFIDVRLAQRDPVDLRGLPIPDGDSVRWLTSSEWPRDPRSQGILLFDELTAADRTLQVAAYELILDRRLGDTYSIPPGWLVCGAGNRSEDSSVSVAMSAALANRFLHLDLVVEIELWTRWAVSHGVRPDVVAFLRHRPELLLRMDRIDLQRGWPSPRSWARASRFLSTADDLSQQAQQAGLTGLIGEGPAIELRAFLRLANDLPDLTAVLQGTETLTIPTQVDLKLLIVTGLARQVWSAADRERALAIFLRIGTELSSDFASLMLADALDQGKPDDVQALVEHGAFRRWREKHGDALTARRPELRRTIEQAGQSELRKPVDASVLDRMRSSVRLPR